MIEIQTNSPISGKAVYYYDDSFGESIASRIHDGVSFYVNSTIHDCCDVCISPSIITDFKKIEVINER